MAFAETLQSLQIEKCDWTNQVTNGPSTIEPLSVVTCNAADHAKTHGLGVLVQYSREQHPRLNHQAISLNPILGQIGGLSPTGIEAGAPNQLFRGFLSFLLSSFCSLPPPFPSSRPSDHRIVCLSSNVDELRDYETAGRDGLEDKAGVDVTSPGQCGRSELWGRDPLGSSWRSSTPFLSLGSMMAARWRGGMARLLGELS